MIDRVPCDHVVPFIDFVIESLCQIKIVFKVKLCSTAAREYGFTMNFSRFHSLQCVLGTVAMFIKKNNVFFLMKTTFFGPFVRGFFRFPFMSMTPKSIQNNFQTMLLGHCQIVLRFMEFYFGPVLFIDCYLSRSRMRFSLAGARNSYAKIC